MITAVMLAEAFTETTEPEHRTEVPPFSEAPDEVVQHFQRAADYLNTHGDVGAGSGLAAADDNHTQAEVSWRVFLASDKDWLADHGRKMGSGVGQQAIERLLIALDHVAADGSPGCEKRAIRCKACAQKRKDQAAPPTTPTSAPVEDVGGLKPGDLEWLRECVEEVRVGADAIGRMKTDAGLRAYRAQNDRIDRILAALSR